MLLIYNATNQLYKCNSQTQNNFFFHLLRIICKIQWPRLCAGVNRQKQMYGAKLFQGKAIGNIASTFDFGEDPPMFEGSPRERKRNPNFIFYRTCMRLNINFILNPTSRERERERERGYKFLPQLGLFSFDKTISFPLNLKFPSFHKMRPLKEK